MRTNPIQSQQVNLALLTRLESLGKEIKLIKRNKKIIGGNVVEPLRKLFEKGVINNQQYHAGNQYCEDYARSEITHHAKPSYDGTPLSSFASGKPSERNLSDSQLNAGKNVFFVREILTQNDTRKVNGFKSFKKFKVRRPKNVYGYMILLDLIFERQLSINAVHTRTNLRASAIENRVIEMLNYMVKYYE